jgi:TolB-like protein/class 3 adenylate cyclase/Tfp pilus assembly protein PilF
MERRLAAILSYDIVGYSRSMGMDETGTLATLKSQRRQVIDPTAAQHGGRTIKLMGDGALMEFASVVDAVCFAVRMQQAISELNASLPERRRLLYRIGINIGDVIVEGEDIYGDGVNIATRLEGLAEPGGVCVRRNVRNQVRGKLDLEFKDLGEVDVKNIERPVRAFHLMMNDKTAALAATPVPPGTRTRSFWPLGVGSATLSLMLIASVLWWSPWAPDIEPVAPEAMALPLPDKPSIAVLPFSNLTPGPEQEFFADGITSDLVTRLSRFRNLFVIAASSTFVYKGKPVKVQTVAEDLGVRYVLEGSVQRIGDTVRVNAQLIDALRGHHLWADQFDRQLEGIFDVQSDVVDEVISAISLELEADERSNSSFRRKVDPETYDLLLHAKEVLPRYAPERRELLRARDLFERVVERAPDVADGYAGLALTHALAAIHRVTPPSGEAVDRALNLAMRLAQGSEFTSIAMAKALEAAGRLEDAIAILDDLLNTAPSSAEAHAQLGLLLIWSGRAEEAIEHVERAIRLNPHVGSPYLIYLGIAYFAHGQYRLAVEAFERNAARGGPVDDAALALWAASHNELGHSDAAASVTNRLIDEYPGFHLRSFPLPDRFVRSGDRDVVFEVLKRADLPMDRPYTR